MIRSDEIKALIQKLSEKAKNFFRGEQFHRSLIFLFFLLLAFSFWVLQALRKDYTYSYEIPVVYENMPPEIIVTGDLPGHIQATLSAKGSTLFDYSYGKGFDTIVIDISKAKKGEKAYSISSDYLKSAVKKQLVKEAILSGLLPDNILIYYALEESKQIPVHADIHVLPASQRMMSGKIDITPDKVTVYASKSVLDTLSSISTIFSEVKNAQDTIYKKVFLKKIPGVKFIPDKVDVMIPVEEFTEKTLEIPVQGINVPNNLTMRTFPSKVNVSFFVVLSKFNDVRDSDFQATIDYSEFKKEDSDGKLKVNLSKVPSVVDNVRLNTSEVDVLMEEKAK